MTNTESIPELETKYHSDQAKKIYTDAKRHASFNAIEYAKNTIITGANKGYANIHISMVDYLSDMATVAEYLSSEYYQITILKNAIIVTLSKTNSTPIQHVNLKLNVKINSVPEVIGVGLLVAGLYLILFLIVGIVVWGGEKPTDPDWPHWYKFTLLWVPTLFSAIIHVVWTTAIVNKTKLIFENNPEAMKWYLYSTNANLTAHVPLEEIY